LQVWVHGVSDARRRRAARRRPRPGSVTSPRSSAPPCGGDATATAFSRDRNANLHSRLEPSSKGARTKGGEEDCVNCIIVCKEGEEDCVNCMECPLLDHRLGWTGWRGTRSCGCCRRTESHRLRLHGVPVLGVLTALIGNVATGRRRFQGVRSPSLF
jgi:hypothetical protein